MTAIKKLMIAIVLASCLMPAATVYAMDSDSDSDKEDGEKQKPVFTPEQIEQANKDLLLAFYNDSLEQVKAALKNGAEINKSSNTCTPLGLAAMGAGNCEIPNCNLEIVKLLLRKKANVNGYEDMQHTYPKLIDPPLRIAISYGASPELVKMLIFAKADCNALCPIEAYHRRNVIGLDKEGNTALALAIKLKREQPIIEAQAELTLNPQRITLTQDFLLEGPVPVTDIIDIISDYAELPFAAKKAKKPKK
jgi:hypothetical protein